MFQSFTGTSRRPRQVNLSGRNANPFAAFPTARQSALGPGPQNTLAQAQQERFQRQQERDRLNASKVLQKAWRGHKSRRETQAAWRDEWDHTETERSRESPYLEVLETLKAVPEPNPYTSATECLSQLRLLLQFLDIKNEMDSLRLAYFGKALQKTAAGVPAIAAADAWTLQLERLGDLTIRTLVTVRSSSSSTVIINDLLTLLIFLSGLIPRNMARHAQEYYSALAAITTASNLSSSAQDLTRTLLTRSALAMLRPITAETIGAYGGFARGFLTIPDIPLHLGSLREVAAGVNYKLLAKALMSQLQDNSPRGRETLRDTTKRMWLLAYFIYFHRHCLGVAEILSYAPETDFIKVVSNILSPMADEVALRLDVEDNAMVDSLQSSPLDKQTWDPLPQFVRSEINTLVNQHSITRLFARIESSQSPSQEEVARVDPRSSEDVKTLTTYALILLRVFPRRGNDIRTWLCLGSATTPTISGKKTISQLPAIKYFWHAARTTPIFRKISQDSRSVLNQLKPPTVNPILRSSSQSNEFDERNQEWGVILLFLELYTFLLRLMDDEEFLSGGNTVDGQSRTSSTLWTRERALPLSEIRDMTVFLKNLGFTLYWNASDLVENEAEDDFSNIRNYFSNSLITPPPAKASKTVETKSGDKGIAGVMGMSLDYLKGLVTGLLRMIHEIDSRRKFLPEGHWLMTGRFDMEGFIPAVVAEEERRHEIQEADPEDDAQDDSALDDGIEDEIFGLNRQLIGNRRAQHVRYLAQLQRRQQKALRKKQLEAVAPRLEILRNLPFFIPFATRVQIFREFVYRDQVRRRNGYVDPDTWRMSVVQSSQGRNADGQPAGYDVINRHHARIRRESVFEDAYEQYYDLGEGLKEPIQISFIDRFDTVEAGIDGGGVTKEFLTSVTNEAFDPSNGLNLFIENDQNLLYPNPASVEQRKDLLRQAGFDEGTAEWNAQLRELYKRYQFLGRVIGKCLYEGILVDVSFAGFFLLKWALTGGTSSASRESAYRANLNDVRDLDEGLYQGLLQLKNYPGDVEDFALNFTVTDTISVPDPTNVDGIQESSRNIEKNLKPNGSNIPVTNQNRLEYISYMAHHRLQVQPYYQTNAFLSGLGQIIQPSWLSMFNQSELQTLVGGDSGEIDLEDLRKNTQYGGVYAIGDDGQEHPSIKTFWDVMKSLSNVDRGKVLKFVTSTPRAPLLGFGHLNPRFSVRDSSDDQERLPSTSTCVNLLKLPRYSNADTLREKLLYAVNSGAGFDLS